MKVAVIGLGYVGLPLAVRLSQLDFDVLGVDKNLEKIRNLQSGILSFAQDEPFLKSYFKKEYNKNKMTFSTNFENISDKDLIFVNVDTPIIGKIPNYSSLTSALKSIAPNLKKRSIVIIESTVSPNTSINLVIPILEEYSNFKVNLDFFVATVPERIRPNHIFEQLITLSRVIGISDKKIQPTLKEVYSQITSGEIDVTDLTTAETVKTVENSFRDVNIAFANQIALACEELGVNVWQIRELVNKSPFHNMHKPGPGVGGHCIPKDPWLLSSSVKNGQLSIIKESRKTNDLMPKHLYDLIKLAFKQKKIDIKKAKLCVLGYSYIEDTDDVRNSPTQTLLDLLKLDKIKYTVHDSNVDRYKKNLLGKIKNSDCIVLAVGHKEYKTLNLKKLEKLINKKILIDGKNFFDKKVAEKYGFIYKGIGNI